MNWIDCKERLPDTDRVVLVYVPRLQSAEDKPEPYFFAMCTDGHWDDFDDDCQPSHWSELPDRPAEKKS